MGLEDEEQISLEEHAETLGESQKQSKISYTRDFLLSTSELAICKKFPSGFDQSLLSEFEDASSGIQDRQRIAGSFSLQSFKRGQYSSSPPTGGDSSSYSRGIYGRWENRSSGWNDRDHDSQSDSLSESGRRFDNQARRSWQSSEHDGLLGSGSFPRPPGVLAPKVRPNDQSQLNKSNESYHPPRPYKAVPHTRSTKDSFNDETFGSTECTNDDRAEEERRRRDSFELMRKEQKKALQEQKLNSDKHRIDPLSEALLEDTKDEKKDHARNGDFDESLTLQISNSDSRKSSLASQTTASRPLVPPGFTTTLPERNSGMKSSIHNHQAEIGSTEIGASLSHGKGKSVKIGTLNNQEEGQSTKEKVANLSSALQVPNSNPDMNDRLHRTSSLSESPETLDSGEIIELDTEVGTTHDTIDNLNEDRSIALQKLFDSALTVNSGDSSGYVEHRDSEPIDTWSPNAAPSSKFAHWFLEEERKPVSSTNDLLSLIVGAEKAKTQVSDAKTSQLISPTIGISEQFIHNKQEEIPLVLTCEDLEQTILSEFTENATRLSQPVPETEHPKTVIDNHASQHLLSLLQKGIGPKEITKPNVETESIDKTHVSEAWNTENTQSSGKSLTLETLFGTAFMRELQSVEAPVSVQRGSVGSGLSSGEIDDSLVASSSVDEIKPNRVRSDRHVLAPNEREKTKRGKVGNWLGSNNPRSEADSLKLQSKTTLGGSDGVFEIQLPEEESLITVSDPLNTSNRPVFTDERSMVGHEGPPFVRGPYDLIDREIPYRNLHAQQQSSPKFHALQMNHGGPVFNHPLDPHPTRINSQMNHQFPSNMVRPPFGHPNMGQREFDFPGQRPLLQQMHMLGNCPPQVLQENPRGAPFLHPHDQRAGFIQDSNPIRFPFGHHQPNFGSLGMLVPAPDDVGSRDNHPEAFQRLIEMELRANSKRMIHPFAGVGHNSQTMHGNELDMGFRYR